MQLSRFADLKIYEAINFSKNNQKTRNAQKFICYEFVMNLLFFLKGLFRYLLLYF